MLDIGERKEVGTSPDSGVSGNNVAVQNTESKENDGFPQPG
jgi:hypothetical protein